MSDRDNYDYTWVCPRCGRRVPRQLGACRCGQAQSAGNDTVAAPRKPTGVVVAVLAIVLVAALAGITTWRGERMSKLSQPAAAGRPSTPSPLVNTAKSTPEPATPEKPALSAEERLAAAMAEGKRLAASRGETASLEDLITRVMPAVVRVEAPSGSGTGFFVKADTILTNVHVVTDNTSVIVRRANGTTVPARVESTTPEWDIAILRIDRAPADQPTVTLGSGVRARAGQEVIAVGSPLGLQNTVTRGIVSAVRQIGEVTLVQTDAAINPGNSGGPLLDAAGNVIGINTAMAQNSSGIGFAIPIDIARPVMRQALAHQKLARPYIGVRYEAIDLQVKTREHLSVDQGALLITSPDSSGKSEPAIIPGGPAEKAGLKEGDIITAVESQTIDAEHPLDLVLSGYAPGQTITLAVLRGGATLDIKLTLGTRPAS
jgi:S1-C subfamily serine protease